MPAKTENGKLDDGIAGASAEELELALLTFQQVNFQSWDQKILAGQFQKRIDTSLKAIQ